MIRKGCIANAEKSFVGSYVLGMGFTFDDLRNQEVATPTAIMDELIAKDPSNREVIFPYIGGDELNTSPSHAHDRFVINFGDRDAEVCRARWPELMAIIEERVKPERLQKKDKRAKEFWWQYLRPRPELHTAIEWIGKGLGHSPGGPTRRLCFPTYRRGVLRFFDRFPF